MREIQKIQCGLLETDGSTKFGAKRGFDPEKMLFYSDVGGFWVIELFSLRRMQAKNYTNSIKKLLLLTDLTIIIRGLVIRINSYQS